ncbi:MAG: hypothetical protein SGI73_19585 [Chloroflexota bacterium]|nr:hypothetical protein [Chloroflexota bacterium]
MSLTILLAGVVLLLSGQADTASAQESCCNRPSNGSGCPAWSSRRRCPT